MRLTDKKIVAALKKNNCKITRQRQAIIAAIASRRERLTPAAIYNILHQAHPNIGLITIYRTLELLAELKLICKLHTGGSSPSYALSAPERHHHLVCTRCGRVVDFGGFKMDRLEAKLARETGFKIDSRIVELAGLCRECQRAAGL